MACKRSPVRSRYSPPLAQIRVTNTVDFKSKSTVFLCLSASKFIAILQILCKIKVEVHMDLVSAINFYPADKLADDHLFCFKAGTIVQVCVRDQFFVQLRYNTYKRLVYHTAYKIMGDSYLAEDVLQEVFLYIAKNFSKIHRENCHALAAYLVSCSRSRAYDMLRKQREEPLEEIPDAPDSTPVPDDAAVSADNIEHLTELIGQMKPMYRDPLRLLAMGYTNREIAESLGLTDEVVRMRLFRGRKLLWKELNSHE